MPDSIEIRLDNKAVQDALLKVAAKAETLRPLMKNIAGIMADATEENFSQQGRPDKWQELAESTIKNVKKPDIGRGKFFKSKDVLQHLLQLNMMMGSGIIEIRTDNG